MPLITITRGSFGASRQVAAMVGKESGCDVVTREEVIAHAREYGLEETGMADTDFMEKHPPQLWDRHAAQRRLYLIFLKASIMDFAANGKLVYLGHMGQFILSDVPKLFRTRVDASMGFRMKGLIEESKLSEAEAMRHIRQIDATRRKWAKFLYGVNYDSPGHYDIVLNLERMTLDSAAEIIVRALSRPEWECDEDAMRTIRNIHLASVVSARLARSTRTRGMEIAVECDAQTGMARIRGISPLVGAKTWKYDIKDVVMGVEGITSVDIIDLR